MRIWLISLQKDATEGSGVQIVCITENLWCGFWKRLWSWDGVDMHETN